MTPSTTFVLRSALASFTAILSATTLIGCGDAATASVTVTSAKAADQTPTQAEALANCLRDSERNINAFMKRDVDGMVALMHPNAAASKSPEQLRAIVLRTFAQMASDETTFERPVLTAPTETFDGGTRLFAIVGESMQFSLKGVMNVAAKSYLLGVSEDQGRSWRFVEGTALKKVPVTQFFPEYPIAQRPLPTMSAPKITMSKAVE